MHSSLLCATHAKDTSGEISDKNRPYDQIVINVSGGGCINPYQSDFQMSMMEPYGQIGLFFLPPLFKIQG